MPVMHLDSLGSYTESQFQPNRPTGFPHYPKVQRSYENFHEPKWCSGEVISLTYMEKILNIPRPKIQNMCNVFISLIT